MEPDRVGFGVCVIQKVFRRVFVAPSRRLAWRRTAKLKNPVLEFWFCEGPVAMNDPPLAINSPVNFGTIPTNTDRFFLSRPFNCIDKVESKNGRVALTLYLWINHIVAVDPNLSGSASYVFLDGAYSIEPLFSCWIEVRDFRSHYVEVTLRIASAPPIKCFTLHGDYFELYLSSLSVFSRSAAN